MQTEHAAKSIYLFKHKHSLVFTALSETDKCILERRCGEWIKNEIASAKISLCHSLTLCFGGHPAMEHLTGIINVFSPEDSAGENKQWSSVSVSGLGFFLPRSPPPGPSDTSVLWSAAPWRWSRPDLLGTSADTSQQEETVSKNKCLLSNLFIWEDLQENTQSWVPVENYLGQVI